LTVPGDLLFIIGGIVPIVYLAIRMFLLRKRYATSSGPQDEEFTQYYEVKGE
jgi:nitric oxide reductase subunit B